jgi:hypothetical protein
MRTRIVWTSEEVSKLVDKLIELRLRQPFAEQKQLIVECQSILDPTRRRTLAGISTAGELFLQTFKTRWDQMANTVLSPKQDAAEAIPPAPPTPPQESVNGGSGDNGQSDDHSASHVTIIEVQVPKIVEVAPPVDTHKVLETTPPAMLLGYVFTKLLPALGGGLVPHQLLQGALPPPPAPASEPANRIVRSEIPEASIQVAGAATQSKRKKVLVVGIIPAMLNQVLDKVDGFSNLDIRFVNNDQMNHMRSLTCEYAILIRRTTDCMIRDRVKTFTRDGRVTFVDGGVHDLLKRLADLNSQQ